MLQIPNLYIQVSEQHTNLPFLNHFNDAGRRDQKAERDMEIQQTEKNLWPFTGGR